jgi:hypothetical protein
MKDTTDLTAALRAHAQGLYCLQAAVELLISHGSWLRRKDFLHYMHTAPDLTDHTPTAPIHWPEAINALDQGQLPCSSSEASMLRLAASLAEGVPIDLRDALTSLDSSNAELVSHAVKHASGYR